MPSRRRDLLVGPQNQLAGKLQKIQALANKVNTLQNLGNQQAGFWQSDIDRTIGLQEAGRGNLLGATQWFAQQREQLQQQQAQAAQNRGLRGLFGGGGAAGGALAGALLSPTAPLMGAAVGSSIGGTLGAGIDQAAYGGPPVDYSSIPRSMMEFQYFDQRNPVYQPRTAAPMPMAMPQGGVGSMGMPMGAAGFSPNVPSPVPQALPPWWNDLQ